MSRKLNENFVRKPRRELRNKQENKMSRKLNENFVTDRKTK